MSVDLAQLVASISVHDTGSAILTQFDAKLKGVAAEAAGPTSRAVDEVGTRTQRAGMTGVGSFNALQTAMTNARVPLGPLGAAMGNFNNTLFASTMLADGWQRKMFIAGSAAAAFGGISMDAAAKVQDAHAKLATAYNNAHLNISNFTGDIQQQIDKGAHLGITKDQVMNALARLVTGFGNENQAIKELNDSYDLAAFRHKDLVQTAGDMVRIIEGHYGRGLKDLGIDMTFVHNTAKALTGAQTELAKATTRQEDAQRHLDEANLRAGASTGSAAKATVEAATATVISTDGITNAQMRHQDAVTHLNQVYETIANGGLKNHTSALHAVNNAQRRVAESNVHLEQSYGRVQAATDRATASAQRHAAAHSGGGGGGGPSVAKQISDQISLTEHTIAVAKAKDAVAAAEAKVQQATLAHQAEVMQGAVAAQLIHERVKGTAEAQANTIGGFFRRVKAEVFNWMADVGSKYGPFITASGSMMAGVAAIGPTLVSAAKGAATFFAAFIKGMMEAIPASLEFAAANIEWIAAIAALVALGVIIYELATHWQQVMNWISGALDTAMNFIKGIIHSVIGWLRSNWDIVLTILTGPIGLAVLIIRRFGSDILNAIVSALHAVIDWLSGNWDIVLTILTGPFGLAVLIIRRFGPDILDILSSLPGALLSLGVDMLQGLLNGILSIWGSVLDFFTNLPGRVLDALGNLADSLWSAGVDAMRGLWNGLKHMATRIIDWAGGFAGDVLHAITDPLGITSPSTVMMQQGQFVMEGLLIGLQNRSPAVLSHLYELAKLMGVRMQDFDFTAAATVSGAGAAGAGVGAGQAGGNVIYVMFDVKGDVITEDQLFESFRDKLIRQGIVGGGLSLGGTG